MIALMLMLAVAAEDFAIECAGKAVFEDRVQGKVTTRSYDFPSEIYVFNEATRRAQRALIPRQEFEDICFRGGYIDTIDFAPGLINIHSEKAGQACDFSVDRKSGEATFTTLADIPGGTLSIEFTMNCKAAVVPKFSPAGNRF